MHVHVYVYAASTHVHVRTCTSGQNSCNTVCDTMFCTATWSSIWQGNLPESPLIRVIWVHWIQLIPCESLTCNTLNYMLIFMFASISMTLCKFPCMQMHHFILWCYMQWWYPVKISRISPIRQTLLTGKGVACTVFCICAYVCSR